MDHHNVLVRGEGFRSGIWYTLTDLSDCISPNSVSCGVLKHQEDSMTSVCHYPSKYPPLISDIKIADLFKSQNTRHHGTTWYTKYISINFTFFSVALCFLGQLQLKYLLFVIWRVPAQDGLFALILWYQRGTGRPHNFVQVFD